MPKIDKRKRSTWFHRISAAVWLVFGVVAHLLGWSALIPLIWFASVYANVKSDWGAAEAADDSAVLAELKELKELVASLKGAEGD